MIKQREVQAADIYYDNFQNMPANVKKKISLYMLREIFEHMVKPALAELERRPLNSHDG